MHETVMKVEKGSPYVVPMVITTCCTFVFGISFLIIFTGIFRFLPMLFFMGLSIAQFIVRKKSNPLKKRKILWVLSIIKMSLAIALLLLIVFLIVLLVRIPPNILLALSMPMVCAFLMFIAAGYFELSVIREMPVLSLIQDSIE